MATIDSPEVSMAKAIRDAVLDQVPGMVEKALIPHTKGMHSDMAVLVGGVVRKELEGMRAEYDARVERLEADYRERIKDLLDVVRETIKSIVPTVNVEAPIINVPVDAIRVSMEKIPAPVVNLPAEAIQVKMLPSIVNLPEKSIQVNMRPSVVNLPEEAIKVLIQQPKRSVEKTIEYGQTGRPEKIIEKDLEG